MLEQHELCGQILDTVNIYLESTGIHTRRAAIVSEQIHDSFVQEQGEIVARWRRVEVGEADQLREVERSLIGDAPAQVYPLAWSVCCTAARALQATVPKLRLV